MNYRLLEFSSINCLRLWRKPEYQEKTTDLWQVDWQTLLQNDVSTTPRYEPGSPLCIVYVPNQKSVLRYRFCLFLPLFWWILEIFRQWYFLFFICFISSYYPCIIASWILTFSLLKIQKKAICLPSWLQKPRQKIEWLCFFTYAYSFPVTGWIIIYVTSTVTHVKRANQ
jgi:hypothetical protein